MAPSQPSQSVPPHLDGVRVDLVIAELFDLSRARAKALAEEGRVKLDGKRVRKGARVEAGQTIALDEPPPPRTFDALPDPSVELVIVHEDDACVIVDKPAGMPCHPLRPEELGTVANGLVARFPSMRGVGFAGREPGLVHRLDNDTSGLLLAAKHEAAFQTLVEALREGRVDKRYVALCAGTVETQTIPTPIVHHDARRMRVAEAGERRARERRGPRCSRAKRSRAAPASRCAPATRAAIRSAYTWRRSATRSSATRSTRVPRSKGSPGTRFTRRCWCSKDRRARSTRAARFRRRTSPRWSDSTDRSPESAHPTSAHPTTTERSEEVSGRV
ncbi:MAG: RluA family pseudouridine synthase [Sandaracinus sp.]|nr:RluA family pseudouridine synthase [Sandaracinus sp.]